MHGLALDFNKEAKEQVLLTEKIIERCEKTETKMKKIDGKLDKFIVSATDGKIWMYIACQCTCFIILLIIA